MKENTILFNAELRQKMIDAQFVANKNRQNYFIHFYGGKPIVSSVSEMGGILIAEVKPEPVADPGQSAAPFNPLNLVFKPTLQDQIQKAQASANRTGDGQIVTLYGESIIEVLPDQTPDPASQENMLDAIESTMLLDLVEIETLDAIAAEIVFADTQTEAKGYKADRTPGEWLLVIESELIEAKQGWCKNARSGRSSVEHEILQVAASAVRALRSFDWQTIKDLTQISTDSMNLLPGDLKLRKVKISDGPTLIEYRVGNETEFCQNCGKNLFLGVIGVPSEPGNLDAPDVLFCSIECLDQWQAKQRAIGHGPGSQARADYLSGNVLSRDVFSPFVDHMSGRIQNSKHKGDFFDWTPGVGQLIQHLRENFNNLTKAIRKHDAGRVRDQAADLANFAFKAFKMTNPIDLSARRCENCNSLGCLDPLDKQLPDVVAGRDFCSYTCAGIVAQKERDTVSDGREIGQSFMSESKSPIGWLGNVGVGGNMSEYESDDQDIPFDENEKREAERRLGSPSKVIAESEKVRQYIQDKIKSVHGDAFSFVSDLPSDHCRGCDGPMYFDWTFCPNCGRRNGGDRIPTKKAMDEYIQGELKKAFGPGDDFQIRHAKQISKWINKTSKGLDELIKKADVLTGKIKLNNGLAGLESRTIKVRDESESVRVELEIPNNMIRVVAAGIGKPCPRCDGPIGTFGFQAKFNQMVSGDDSKIVFCSTNCCRLFIEYRDRNINGNVQMIREKWHGKPPESPAAILTNPIRICAKCQKRINGPAVLDALNDFCSVECRDAFNEKDGTK
jgi:hypothetical protein